MFWVSGLMAGGVIGLVLLLLGVRGSPVLSTPRCRRCKYDLRGFTDAVPTRCTECGSDLTQPHAVIFGRFERQPKLAVTGMLVLLLTIGTTFGLREYIAGRFQIAPPVANFKTATTAGLLAALPHHAEDSPYWNELAERLARKKLSPGDCALAIDGLTAFLQGNPNSFAPDASRDFVMAADADNLIDPTAFDKLVHAVAPHHATAAVRPTMAVGETYDYRVEYDNNHNSLGEYELVKGLTEIQIDHGTVTIEGDDRHHFSDGMGGGDRFEGRLKIDAPPGPHTLTFVVDAGLLYPGSVSPFGGPAGPPSTWPKARTKWSANVRVPVTIVPTGTPTVRLVTDPKLDPIKRGALKVPEIKVTAGGNGSQFDVNFDVDGSVIPQAYTVDITVDGATHTLGTLVAGFGRSSFESAMPNYVPLSPKTTTATLRFTPAPNLPSTDDHIWGLPVKLKDVPLKRYDLKASSLP